MRLTRVRALIRKERRQLFRDPRSFGVIFVAPVLQLMLFGYAVNTDVRNVTTWVVDHDRTAASRALVDGFTAAGYFRIVGQSDDPGSMGRALDHGEAVVGLWIPRGFSSSVLAQRSPTIQVLLDGSNSNTATVAQGYAQGILSETGLKLAREAGTQLPPRGIELRSRAWFNPSLESRVYNVPAVIGVIVLLMCLLLTALGVVREREMGTLDQLLVAPVRPSELMLGKTLPVAGIAMVQLTLITTVALLWFEIPLRGSIPALVFAAGLFILAGLSVGILISTISSTQQEAFLSMFLLVLPAIILSGFLYPVETMPKVFQTLTLANPLRHFLEIVRGIFLKGSGIAELSVQFTALAVMAAIGSWAANRRFRRMLG